MASLIQVVGLNQAELDNSFDLGKWPSGLSWELPSPLRFPLPFQG